MYQSHAPVISRNADDELRYPCASSTSQSAVKIKQMTSEQLLKALIDPDQTLRLMAQNFWI